MTTTQIVCACLFLGARPLPAAGETRFTVATYNLENYHLQPIGNRDAKPPESRAKVQESILAIRPDVLALQEIGDTNSLLDLQRSLRLHGLDLPYWDHVLGSDTNIFVAVLSRFPFLARHPRTNESFLLDGRRFRTSRGFAELEIGVTPAYRFTLLAAHLKSKRPMAEADEGELREQEAQRLRLLVERILKRNPKANVLVCGDLNDTREARSTRALIGSAEPRLQDTRPAERNGDTAPAPNPRWEPRNVTWTHFYAKEDTYSRFDYILLSRGMAREWRREGTYVLALPNWGLASDHRPVVAEFVAEDR